MKKATKQKARFGQKEKNSEMRCITFGIAKIRRIENRKAATDKEEVRL